MNSGGLPLSRGALAAVSEPLLLRLQAMSPLTEAERSFVIQSLQQTETHSPGTEIFSEDAGLLTPRIISAGWACRSRLLSDGRKQILEFLIPGDTIGPCLRRDPLSLTNSFALTTVETVDASLLSDTLHDCPEIYRGLRQAFAIAAAHDQCHLLDQIVRLGRQTAYERTAHLFLELQVRLQTVGLSDGTRFRLPITQEALSDGLGLSIVHLNRTLQQLRRDRLIELQSGTAVLLDREMLAITADYQPVRPSGW